MAWDVSGKTILVTGATSGIGAECCGRLRSGVQVCDPGRGGG
jgi:NAD(P)-dependent dehydrogenase (short-subunit alcohol dehydrogenase family)